MKTAIFLPIFLLFSISAMSETSLQIDSVSFNSESLKFKITWHADSITSINNIQYGITASPGKLSNDPPFSHIPLNKLSNDTVLSVSGLVFDTSYYLGIWTYSDGLWNTPDSLSSKKVFVSSSIKQPISIFASGKTTDTIKALCKKVMLWKDSTYPLGISPHQDTIIAYVPATTQLKGFVRLSTGIRFAHPEPSLPFHIALSIDSITNKYTNGQIHLYRDSAGLFIPEISSVFDKEKLQVSMKISDLRLPLIVLADTTPPIISVLPKIAPIIKSVTLYDTVVVSDNSAGLSWSFYSVPGSELLKKPLLSGRIKGISGRIICPISAGGAEESGMRAVLVFSDGAYTDTLNMSKQSIRNNSDPVTIPENMIIPISTTTQLDTPGVRYSLKTLFAQSGGKYDPSHFRIYRWLPDNSNSANSNKWIEYSSANQASFSLTPGNLIWLICSKTQLIDFGKGITISLKDTAKIVLPAKNWTDFNNPFSFNLNLSDILKSSGKGSSDLAIYKWVEDRLNKTYRTSLVYNKIISNIDSLKDTIHAMQCGYTVYNHGNSATELRFPPVPYSAAGSTGNFLNKSKSTNSQNFTIKVTANSGDKELGTVYCGLHGSSSDTLSYPLPPTFGEYSIVVTNQTRKDSCGIRSIPYSNSIPAIFYIDVKHKSANAIVNINTDIIRQDFGASYALFDRKENGVELSSGKNIQLTGGYGSFALVAGGIDAIDSYRAQNHFTVKKAPSAKLDFSGRVLRLQMNGMEQSECTFELYTMQGKRVHVQNFATTTSESKVMPISLPAGVYIARIKFTRDMATVFSMTQKFSFFHKDM